MTIAQALAALTTYPVPANTIEAIAIERALTITDPFDATVAESKGYKLSQADVFMFLYGAPDLQDQDIRISLKDRETFRKRANAIYADYGDPKFSGRKYGFIGEKF